MKYKVNFRGKGKTPEIAVEALFKAARDLEYNPEDLTQVEVNQMGKSTRGRISETYWVSTGHIMIDIKQ